MPNIAIIVLHFGDKKNTLECLESIKKINYDPSKINTIVIDNSKHNLGFAGGVNKGIKVALKDPSVKYILLLNNDVVIESASLKLLSDQCENENIDIAGGIITYYDDRDKIWFAGGYLNKKFCFTTHPYMNTKYHRFLPLGKIDFITGAVMLVRRGVFEKIGFFDEDYFLYWEDVDFCLRAAEAKCKIYCLNSIIAYHKISFSSGLRGSNRLTPLKAYYFARNPFLFMKKNNLPFLTGFLGQIFVRLPYYFFSLTGINSFYQYLKGINVGVKYLYSH